MKLITLSEAMNILTKLKLRLGVEVVDLTSSLGRVLAEDVISDIDIPPFNKSARDGYAVKAEDTFTASDFNPVKLKLKGHVKIGEIPSFSLSKNECAYVPTGAPIPQGSDAVVMIEDASQEGDYVKVYKSIAPSRNVIHRGSDIPKGSMLLRRGVIIGVKEISLLAAIGRDKIRVFSKPKVAVISTGYELTEVGLPLQAGKIYDINSHLISSYMKRLSCEVIGMGIVADEPERLREAMLQALSISDFVLISGGTSKGEDDILYRTLCDIIKVEGGVMLFHGLALKPGKPTLLAMIRNKLIFGLPGNPASTFTVLEVLVKPWLLNVVYGSDSRGLRVRARLSRKVQSFEGRKEIVYVKLEKQSDELVAQPILKGSEMVTTFAQADGYIEVPEMVNFIEEGSIVEVKLLDI